MNIESKIDEIVKTTAWYNQQIIQKKDTDRQKLKIQVQHLFHEISLIRYFSYNTESNGFGHFDISYEKIIAAFMQHEPLRLHSKLSPNISQFITQWVFDFANKPKKFAEGVIKTLPRFPIDSGIFIYVTFPSMFYHFQTDEYLNLAVEFLEEIIQKSPQNMSIAFVSAFLLSATKFIKSLWIIFDELVDKRSPIRTYSDYFVIFIEALKSSSSALTKQHVHIIEFFKKFNLENFARCLFSNFLNITYDESHLSKIHDESRELIHFFNYAEKNPNSPHFTKIYNALIPKKGTFWVPFHSDLIETRIPLVMNCHEFFLIQQIAKDNPDISNLKYIQYLMIPKNVYLDFCPVYFDVVFPLPPLRIKDQIGSLIFNSNFYEKERKNFIINDSNENNNENAETHLLSRKWRQINAYARTKNIHPLSLFSSKIVKKDPSFEELSSFNFTEDSPLFEYAVKDVYSEALKIHNQFEVLMNRLLLADFLRELYQLLFFMLKVVLQKFTLRLINSDRIYDNYYLNDLIGTCSYKGRFTNFAVLRFSDHFDVSGNDKKNFKMIFFPSQMKKERIKKLLLKDELFNIYLIGIGKPKEKRNVIDHTTSNSASSTNNNKQSQATNLNQNSNQQTTTNENNSPQLSPRSLTAAKEASTRPPNPQIHPTRSPSFSQISNSAPQRILAAQLRASSYSTSSSPSRTATQTKEKDNDSLSLQKNRQRRRHSLHSIEFIHTSSEFLTSVNRILKLRGRTKSPLEICMISKIIDEWRIIFFDKTESDEAQFNNTNSKRSKQLFGNGEVCEFIISSLQKNFISNIELWKTKIKMNKSENGEKFNELKSAFKYILYTAKEINVINNLKKGEAIFQMIHVGTLIDQISVKLLSEKKVNKRNNIELGTLQFKVFEMCLLMSNSQGLFETFLLYEKLSADIIGFNTSIPLNVMKYILIVVKCFWKMIKDFDNDLYLSCIHFVEHIQYNFTI